jgi:signal transduction histidine kinase
MASSRRTAAGRHIFANPALAELAGLSIEEILGKDDFDLVADKAQAEAYRADDLAVNAGAAHGKHRHPGRRHRARPEQHPGADHDVHRHPQDHVGRSAGKKILETIEVSAKRGADIVRQVLSFARGLEGERIEVQPKHLLKDLENIIKDTFPKDIRLQFSIPNDTWTILGDPTQVHQILLNLCVNARDAMPNGGNLTIGVENCVLDEQYAAMNIQAKPGRYVNISVTDSGTGMPPGILDKIFEPFFTTKELNKGTGLGLSTVMAIVKSHEGIINVYSEPGKGTTFKVYLPAMELSSEAREGTVGAGQLAARKRRDGFGGR